MKKPLLTIASGNPRKVKEIALMLGPLNVEIHKQPQGLEVEETGSSYLENALLKAKAAAKLTNTWALADDSGLEVDALNDEPGIYSARFAENNQKKIEKILTAIGNSPYRSARFISVMALCDPNGNEITNAKGICWGELLKSPAYPGGEFESIFWVREAKCTYGELTEQQLTKLGSRGKAARGLAESLKKVLNL